MSESAENAAVCATCSGTGIQPDFGPTPDLVPCETCAETVATTVTERRSLRCGMDAGERPGWMSPGQYDPCPCVRPKGHARAAGGGPGHACGDHDKPGDAIEPDRFEERQRTTFLDVVTDWVPARDMSTPPEKPTGDA